MTFKEFTRAIKQNPRAMELLDQCHPECGPMSNEDTKELEEIAHRISEDFKAVKKNYPPAHIITIEM